MSKLGKHVTDSYISDRVYNVNCNLMKSMNTRQTKYGVPRWKQVVKKGKFILNVEVLTML